MDSLFSAQTYKPAGLNDINWNQLTPFHRALLVNDGTVTQLIEAYLGLPVEVELLSQEKQQLKTPDKWLQTETGTTIINRRVILRSSPLSCPDQQIHTYAISQLVYNRLPPEMQQGLGTNGIGLGRLLRQNRMETRRDLLWYGLEHNPELSTQIGTSSAQPFLSRSYLVIRDGVPMMRVTEKFPLPSANFTSGHPTPYRLNAFESSC